MRLSKFIAAAVVVLSFLFVKNDSGWSQAPSNPIDRLNPGEWYRVPNSHLSAVLPNPIPAGNTGPPSLMIAWNSGAYDTTRDRLLIWGGGHKDYSGNELYAFNVNSLRRFGNLAIQFGKLNLATGKRYSGGGPLSDGGV